jgi:hypothetical protein
VKVTLVSGKNVLQRSETGVALSSKKALTSFHGGTQVGDDVSIMDRRGRELKGKIGFSKFELNVDISVIVLNDEYSFDQFIPFQRTPIKLLQQLYVIGLSPTVVKDDYTPYMEQALVTKVETGFRSIFQTRYYYEYGLFGSGIVTCKERGHFTMVGIRIALSTNTVSSNDKQKKKKLKSSKGMDNEERCYNRQMTSSDNINGNHAFCLICEIVRVEGLVEYLNKLLY